MSLPVLHPPNNLHSYVRGDVTIHPSAAIAPGVILQAGPGCRIVIAAGVCIGMGTILHAYQGVLEIEAGVSLGAGVLMVGQGRIGANTCIGSSTTIFNSSIDRDQIIPAGSIVGDTSRRFDELNATDTVILPDAVISEAAAPIPAPVESASPDPFPAEAIQATGINVYGKVYVNQLMVKLLPNRQPIQPVPPTEEQALPSDPWEE
ncbi:hypothetical protein BST81_19265 [Leptolyngbya sp. 'hensonii']|uniref:hypothetical protein n=1 Tax=Leptolyngbya sp. 'hensonii' TaxID=1922337 RepID=UPI00095005A5|nr:hypothetical protein [Leptolyngbya sp. 'hensonii']OLP16836.1 hypothetical protein BST81_19265 [Leptolyngbya sp. 'hensonii']